MEEKTTKEITENKFRSRTTTTGKNFVAETSRFGSNSVLRRIEVKGKRSGIVILIEGDKPLSELDQLRGFLKTLSRDLHKEEDERFELLND